MMNERPDHFDHQIGVEKVLRIFDDGTGRLLNTVRGTFEELSRAEVVELTDVLRSEPCANPNSLAGYIWTCRRANRNYLMDEKNRRKGLVFYLRKTHEPMLVPRKIKKKGEATEKDEATEVVETIPQAAQKVLGMVNKMANMLADVKQYADRASPISMLLEIGKAYRVVQPRTTLGCVVAYEKEGIIKVGWSLCRQTRPMPAQPRSNKQIIRAMEDRKRGDIFNRTIGVRKAIEHGVEINHLVMEFHRIFGPRWLDKFATPQLELDNELVMRLNFKERQDLVAERDKLLEAIPHSLSELWFKALTLSLRYLGGRPLKEAYEVLHNAPAEAPMGTIQAAAANDALEYIGGC
jgi:hypothetical protein